MEPSKSMFDPSFKERRRSESERGVRATAEVHPQSTSQSPPSSERQEPDVQPNPAILKRKTQNHLACRSPRSVRAWQQRSRKAEDADGSRRHGALWVCERVERRDVEGRTSVGSARTSKGTRTIGYRIGIGNRRSGPGSGVREVTGGCSAKAGGRTGIVVDGVGAMK